MAVGWQCCGLCYAASCQRGRVCDSGLLSAVATVSCTQLADTFSRILPAVSVVVTFTVLCVCRPFLHFSKP